MACAWEELPCLWMRSALQAVGLCVVPVQSGRGIGLWILSGCQLDSGLQFVHGGLNVRIVRMGVLTTHEHRVPPAGQLSLHVIEHGLCEEVGDFGQDGGAMSG